MLEQPRVMRPWGYYEGVASGPGFQVKRIKVMPGQALSLQKHAHRSEYWIVISGVAEVECDHIKSMLRPNQSFFIPQGSIHRLSNPGSDELEVIEVQSGNYLGEDDIVRFSEPVLASLEQLNKKLAEAHGDEEQEAPISA